jgi:hypothetical protein
MFSNLFGKKESENIDQLFKDRAYMSTAAKMKACSVLARENESVLFIAWFNDTAKQFKEYLKSDGLNENRIVEVTHLTTHQLLDHTPVFIEHYPIHTKEENFVSNWNIRNILVYSAMDEPLFKHFGSEKLIPLMKMMGMKESEVIEHSMVTKSIINGQKKIEEQVIIEQAAHSQAEWMDRNLKNPV